MSSGDEIAIAIRVPGSVARVLARIPPAPPLQDARYLQAAILLCYSFAARQFFSLESSHLVGFGCLIYACVLDYVLGLVVFRKPVFPLSAVIIGLSSSILIDSDHWIGYYFVVTVACLSKALLRYKGKHIFNPTCIGVTFALMFFPDDIAGIPHLFAGYVWPSVIFGALGVCTVIAARQSVVSFAWLGSFIVFAIVRALLKGASVWFTMAPFIGTAILLFTFHMISDPGTTPRTRRWQVAFGVSAAAIDAVLRYNQIPFGQFYALAIMGAALPWIRDFEEAAGT